MNFPSLSWYDSTDEVENDSNNTRKSPPSFMGRLFEPGLPTAGFKALDRTDTEEETDSLEVSGSSDRVVLPVSDSFSTSDMPTDAKQGTVGTKALDHADREEEIDRLEVSGSSDRAVIPVADSFNTPDKPTSAKQNMTPSTGDASDIFADTPETEPESPYCGADVSGIVQSMSSFMSGDSQSTAFHHDRMRFRIRKPRQEPPDFSLRATEKEALLKSRKHLSPFAYGKKLTVGSVLFALTGIVLAVLSRTSLSFVKIDNRIEISPQLNEVEYIGLVRLRLCYNETSTGSSRKLEDNAFTRLLSTETVPSPSAGKALSHHDQTGCFVLRLTTETIDDTMWNVSRSFLSLAIAFGSFLSIMLCLSIYWESINLKPVALGLLLTYFFQSLSFFFFDSDLCRDNTCRLAGGSIMSILASLCWFLSGLCCIRMDVLYQAQQRKWDRRRKRAIKKLKLQRKYSEATEATTITEADDASSRILPEGRNLAFIFDEEAQEVVDLQNWLASGDEDDVLVSPVQSDEYHV